MKVKCQTCDAIFTVDQEKVPEKGIKAKCSKCSAPIFIERQSESDDKGDGVKYNDGLKYNIEDEASLSTKKCPYCKEVILLDARKCKWCQSNLGNQLENSIKKKVKESKFYRQFWDTWNFGEKVIFSASVAAICSMFFPWVTIGILSKNGWQQQVFYVLILFGYPMVSLAKKKSVNVYYGYFASALSILLTVWYRNTREVEFFGSNINVSSSGSWIFVISVLLFAYGHFKLGSEGDENIKIRSLFSNIFSHKWWLLIIIFIIAALPASYHYLSIKINKPYNMLMNISTESSVDEINEANKNIKKIKSLELIETITDHVAKLTGEIDEYNDGSEEFYKKKQALLDTSVQVLFQRVELLYPGMSSKYLEEGFATNKKYTPSVSKSIKDNCEEKWKEDYSMVEYCIKKQLKSKRYIDNN